MSDNSKSARVTGAYGRRMKLRLCDGSDVDARVKGRKLRPVCGDNVTAEPLANESDWLITNIDKRRNQLTRPDTRGRTEVLAANIDTVVVMAAILPKPDWFIVDRYIAAAEIMGAEIVVVFNKTDLADIRPDDAKTLEEYRQCGYRVLETSAATGDSVDDLVTVIDDGISILVGQSGVGKSSVINRIDKDAGLRTGAVSSSTGEGRHTTVNAVMLELPAGGGVIDSPGVRDYAPVIESADSVVTGFREIARTGQQCRFANCRHLREPDCAVKAAVEGDTISARRYESYKRLLNLTNELVERRR